MKTTLALLVVLCVVSSGTSAAVTATVKAQPPAAPAKVKDGSRPSPSGTFSGDYRDSKIRDVLFDITKAGHLNLVMPAEITGSITAHFEKMPIAKALDFVAGLAGADYRIDEGTVYLTKRAPAAIASPDRTSTTETRVVQRRIVEEDREYELYRPRRVEPREQPVRVETRVIIQNKTVETPRYRRYGYDDRFGGRRIEVHPGFYITTWPTQVYHVPFGPYW
ncbi:MAG: hypothetical protein GYA63_04630 [Armatimonadetes bacterium]|jgi:hypothetical protein|nr:hypothetical protein [Armatimonadota bacterium]HOC31656.1 hypothetical protein [Armatimonadota bacterium]